MFGSEFCMRLLSAPYCSHSNINSSALDQTPCDPTFFLELLFFFFYCCQDKNINSLRFLSSRGRRSQVWLSFGQQQCLFSICRLGNKYQQTPLYLSIDWMKQSQTARAHKHIQNGITAIYWPEEELQRVVHLCHIHRLCVIFLSFLILFFRRSQVS